MKTALNLKHYLICAAAFLLLVGCASKPQTLYQWEGYQYSVYQYFKGESQQEQIIALEKGLEKIRAEGKLPPPGYHAHLGMLYASTGKDDQAILQLETEKKNFPEAAPYMDFLLKKYKKKA